MANRRRRRRRPPAAQTGTVRAPEPAASEKLTVNPPSKPAKAAAAPPLRETDAGSASNSGRRADFTEKFAALDLGTNNCRLLIASPRGRGFRVFDAFSRIVRLGEGVTSSGALSEAAMERTIEALKVCADKIARRGVTRQRCIATQACRAASNGEEFLARVRAETGLIFEIISPDEEARLAVSGCAELVDSEADAALVFDIGGGSTELSWLRAVSSKTNDAPSLRVHESVAWTSMPIGVVSLSEKFGGRELSRDNYDKIVTHVRATIAEFGDPAQMRAAFEAGGAHFLGTSGTVTSIAGVYLKLPRYRREAVDGLWLTAENVREVSERLRAMSFEERAAEPCIGQERADLVVCGCAILDALLAEWPAARIRVADRGLREGILTGLAQDHARRRNRRRRRTGARPRKAAPA